MMVLLQKIFKNATSQLWQHTKAAVAQGDEVRSDGTARNKQISDRKQGILTESYACWKNSEPGPTPPHRNHAQNDSRNAMILEKSTASLPLLFHSPTRSPERDALRRGCLPRNRGYSYMPQSHTPLDRPKSSRHSLYQIELACVKSKVRKHCIFFAPSVF